MYTRVVTKNNEELWLWKNQPVLTRAEVHALQYKKAEVKFANYLRKTERLI